MLDDALKNFGQRLGMDGLCFSERGVAALDIEDSCRLFCEKNTRDGAEELLIYARTALHGGNTAELLAQALRRCAWQEGLPLDMAAGLKDGELYLLVRLPVAEADARTLENTALLLCEEMDALTRG